MSKSYKKTPIVKDNQGGRKKAKREANKKVRNLNWKYRLCDGSGYKKMYERWDIYDYELRYTEKSFLKERESDLKEYINTGERTEKDIENFKKGLMSYNYWRNTYKNK